jgi:hypothetical protein
MIKPTLIAALVTSSLTLEAANAQRTPTDIELKAAYCIKVAKGTIASFRPLLVTDGQARKIRDDAINEASDRQKRLQIYLEPRLSQLEPVAILGASKRGELDGANYFNRMANLAEKCAASCPVDKPNVATTKDHPSECMEGCLQADEWFSRLQSCVRLNWLPF